MVINSVGLITYSIGLGVLAAGNVLLALLLNELLEAGGTENAN